MTACSKVGKGLFTAGFTGFAFASLGMVSARADEIHRTAKKKIEANASKYPPGLLEQYEIQLERLNEGAPGIEFISHFGFASAPSTFCFSSARVYTDGLL
jgi:hypothetical protein